MKYSYKLSKEDYIEFLEFLDSIQIVKRLRSPIKILFNIFGKPIRKNKHKKHVNNNIREDLLGSRELTIEPGVLKINDMRIERILIPNDLKGIYSRPNYFFIILKAEQTFIVENKNNVLQENDFENNGFKLVK